MYESMMFRCLVAINEGTKSSLDLAKLIEYKTRNSVLFSRIATLKTQCLLFLVPEAS